jgi:hypothetical protein
MAKEKPKVQSILESLFVHAVDKLEKAEAGRLIGCLYVRINITSGEIQIYDEQESLLEKKTIFDWADRSEKNVRSYNKPLHSIRAILTGLKSRKFFEKPLFMPFFSIYLVDDKFSEIETIFTCGEDGVPLEGRVMKNLEQELQSFSKNLFADIE